MFSICAFFFKLYSIFFVEFHAWNLALNFKNNLIILFTREIINAQTIKDSLFTIIVETKLVYMDEFASLRNN